MDDNSGHRKDLNLQRDGEIRYSKFGCLPTTQWNSFSEAKRAAAHGHKGARMAGEEIGCLSSRLGTAATVTSVLPGVGKR